LKKSELLIVEDHKPQNALALLLAVYGAATYGGAISAILINIPGSPANICTVFDGYPLKKRGKANKALELAVIFSAISGAISVLFLILIAPIVANIALKFGPVEFFSVCLFVWTYNCCVNIW